MPFSSRRATFQPLSILKPRAPDKVPRESSVATACISCPLTFTRTAGDSLQVTRRSRPDAVRAKLLLPIPASVRHLETSRADPQRFVVLRGLRAPLPSYQRFSQKTVPRLGSFGYPWRRPTLCSTAALRNSLFIYIKPLILADPIVCLFSVALGSIWTLRHLSSLRGPT